MVNSKVASTLDYVGLKNASKGIYKFGSKGSTLAQGLAVVKYTGDVWQSLAMVAVVLFHSNFKTDEEMHLLVEFLHFLFLVSESSPISEQVLGDLIFNVKKQWQQVFPMNELESNGK